MGPSERWRNDEAATAVVEGWQDDRGRGLVFNTSQVRSFGGSGEGDCVDRAIPIAPRIGELGFDVCRGSGALAGGVRWLGGGYAMGRSGDRGLVPVAVRRAGHAEGRKEIQSCECQKGRDGGVRTHQRFRRRGTPEQFLN